MTNRLSIGIRIFLFLALVSVLISSSVDPPNGRTGAPEDGVCSDCHEGNNFAGTVSILGLPEMVKSGETYTLSISVNNTDGNAINAGFQMVSLFDQGLENSGEYKSISDDVGISISGGRSYVEHRDPKNFDNNFAEWIFEWKAPITEEDMEVIMFAAGNITNDNGSSSGDASKFTTGMTTVLALPDPIEVSLEIMNLECNGSSLGSARAEVIGGTPPYNFLWSTGDTTEMINSLESGEYSITISDSAGEELFESFVILEPAPLGIESDITKVVCYNGASGGIQLAVFGGTGPYTYQWSNGNLTPSISNLSSGSYEITITDANNCGQTFMFELDNPDSLSADIITTDETASQANDGTVDIMINGGVQPYNISWDGGIIPNSEMLEPGTYILTITDEIGCSIIKEFSIAEFTCDFTVNLNFNNITCNGRRDGEATVDPEGFTQPISVKWSTGEADFIFVLGLETGNYDVTVTDGTGCTLIEDFVISEPAPLELSFENTFFDCMNLDSNRIESIVSGGIPPYTYSWSQNSTASSLINVALGSYMLTATDANGCEIAGSIVLNYMDTIPPSFTVVDSMIFYLDSAGFFTIDPEVFDLSVSDDCAIDSLIYDDLNLDCNDLGFTKLSLTIFDVNENFTRDTILIELRDTIAPEAICPSDIISGSCDSIFYNMPEFIDNCGVDSIFLAEGLPSGAIFPQDSTKITYYFYDKAGNFGCCSFYVVVETDLELTIDTVINATSEIGGLINVSAIGGSGNYEYEWIYNDTLVISNLEDVGNLQPGVYKLKLTDSNGCILFSESILIELESSTFDPFVEKLYLFPNPTSSKIFFSKEIGIKRKVSIFDLEGKRMVINDSSIISKGIDVSDFPPGIYFLKWYDEANNGIIKFIKQ